MADVNANITSQLVKDHAAAFSTQSKLTNRLWITLVALIFVVVLPAGPRSCVEPGSSPGSLRMTGVDL